LILELVLLLGYLGKLFLEAFGVFIDSPHRFDPLALVFLLEEGFQFFLFGLILVNFW
jgi:hypothetical protein